FRIQRQLFHWFGETNGDEVAGDKTAEQKHRAHAAEFPAQPSPLRDGLGHRINANLVSRWKKRPRIKTFVKDKLRSTAQINDEIISRAITFRKSIRKIIRQNCPCLFRKRRHVQAIVCPNSAFHFHPRAAARDLEWFEAHYQRRNNFAGLSRKYRDRDHFVDRVADKIDIVADVA